MFRPRTLLFVFLLILSFAWLSSSGIWKRNKATLIGNREREHTPDRNSLERMKQKAEAAKLFIARQNYNDNILFLVDMSLPSGQSRFFVYNLKKTHYRIRGLSPMGDVMSTGSTEENMVTRWVAAALHWENTRSVILTPGNSDLLLNYTGSTKQMITLLPVLLYFMVMNAFLKLK